MLCTSCSKLIMMVAGRTCSKCSNKTNGSLSILCDDCSDESKMCSMCLKKMIPISTRQYGCGACKK